jgi:hypothetical protein
MSVGPIPFRRPLVVLLSLSLGVVGMSAPGLASHTSDPRNGLQEAGFHPLGNKGFNTDIMPWVSQEGGVYAATGTWGSILAPVEGDDCPSDDDLTGEDSGVHIIDATDPAAPTLASRLGTIPGAQNNDIKVDRLPTTSGETDLLVHSLEPCGAEGLIHQIPGSPFIDFATTFQQQTSLDQTGFQVYDVDDPSNPVKLGTWNNGGIGTHNLWVFSQGSRSFVAAVFNKVDFVGVEEEDLIVGILQIVEITDPSNPTLVSEWRLSDVGLDCPARGNDSAHCFLHDVTVSADGTLAYLSYWDAGLILLDLTDPASPVFVGQALDQVQEGDPEGWLNEEGNTHAAVPITIDGRDLVIVGDEDFTGGGEIGVTINAPGELAGFHKATQWDGTAPVTGQTADLVYAGTGCTAAHYAGLDVAGKIALVDKFVNNLGIRDCPTFLFKQKMDAAETAGAIGLVQIDSDDAPSAGTAIESGIPGLEITRKGGLPLRDEATDGDGIAVNATLGRGGTVDPWGFMRVVDVTNLGDPSTWREVAQFKAPHVEDSNPGPEDVFSAHNPVIGPDGRIYFSWYTDGARVLELSNGGATVNEVAWFVPLPSDHPDDNDSDPNQVQEDNVGFWGSWPVCHPNGDLLVFNSDLNRGIYVLEAQYDDCRTRDLTLSSGDITFSKQRVGGADVVTIHARIHNLGTGDAANVEVRFEVDGAEIGRTTIASIPAGGSATTSILWGNVKHLQGTHTVVVTADPDNDIEETDEGNNAANRLVEVRGNKIRPQ